MTERWYLQRKLVMLGIALTVGLVASSPPAFLHAQGSAPEITYIDFPGQILADGKENPGNVLFKDPTGDIVKISFDLVQGESTSLQVKPGWEFDPQVSGKKEGVIPFTISATAPQQVKLSVTLTDSAASASTPVEFSFEAVGSSRPPETRLLQATPANLRFTATQGDTNLGSQSLQVTNTGGGTLNWTAGVDIPWLRLTPTSGTAPSIITVSVNIAALAAGSYQGQITISSPGAQNSPMSIAVTLSLAPMPPERPTARFTASPATGPAPLTVQFINQATNFTSSSWDFGDGGHSSETNPAHTYQNVGSYNAALVVQGPGGQDRASTTITVTGPSSRCGDVLYQDDFSDPNSGWYVGADTRQGFDWGYTDDGDYRVLAGSAGWFGWSWAPTNSTFSDFCLEVDVKQIVAGSLSDDGYMGLIFAGNPGARTFTDFVISPGRGIYSMGSLLPAEWKTQVDWTRSDAITGVNNWNHLLIIALNGKVSFYVNDTLLATISLNTSGSVGVIDGTFDKPNTNAHFDNFKVRAAR